jgi:hypothetical protein
LALENCTTGIDRRGVKLRKVSDVSFKNHYHAGTREALDIDSSVKRVRSISSFWQAAATKTVSGQRVVYESPKNPNTGPLSPDFVFDEAANTKRDEIHDGVISSTAITLDNNAIAAIGDTNTAVLVVVILKQQALALYALNGANHSVNEISDPSGSFTSTAGTGASANIYWSAGNNRYELENKFGSTQSFVVVPIGAYS